MKTGLLRPFCLTIPAAAILLGGCVSDNPGERPKVGPPPANPVVGRMFMAAQAPQDTDSNGYMDTFVVTIYLFQTNYARSVRAPGEFHFKLTGKGGKVLREWTLKEPGPLVAAINAGVGPGYVMKMSLLVDKGTDEFPVQSAEVVASFIDKSGIVVEAQPTALLIGKIVP